MQTHSNRSAQRKFSVPVTFVKMKINDFLLLWSLFVCCTVCTLSPFSIRPNSVSPIKCGSWYSWLIYVRYTMLIYPVLWWCAKIPSTPKKYIAFKLHFFSIWFCLYFLFLPTTLMQKFFLQLKTKCKSNFKIAE